LSDVISPALRARNYSAIFDPMPIFVLEIDLSTDAVLRLRGRGMKTLVVADQEFSATVAIPDDLPRAVEGLERRWQAFLLADPGTGARGELYANLFRGGAAFGLISLRDSFVKGWHGAQIANNSGTLGAFRR
jgi:hypothetical protein